MRDISFWVSIAGLTTAAIAALYWFRASLVKPVPAWAKSEHLFEPVIPQLSQNGWITGLLEVTSESARLNKLAAIWTGVSVLLGGISTALNWLI